MQENIMYFYIYSGDSSFITITGADTLLHNKEAFREVYCSLSCLYRRRWGNVKSKYIRKPSAVSRHIFTSLTAFSIVLYVLFR